MTRPRLRLGTHLFRGIVAIALFALLAIVAMGTDLGPSVGFGGDVSITAGIGYLLFDFTGQTPLGDEGFLAAFEIVDVVLVAALVGAVMLAQRDHDEDTGGDDS